MSLRAPIRPNRELGVRVKWWLVLWLFIGLAFGQAEALAQSPGPLSLGHSSLDGAVDCNKCHTAGYGVPNNKCLSCHTHQPLRSRIRAGKGYHASSEVRGDDCFTCHAEHIESPRGSGRGKRTLIDWKPHGGQEKFDHELAGWPLKGQHRKQDCEKCHTDTYPESKLPSFLGQRKECTTCHFGTAQQNQGKGGGNPHQFTDMALTDCQVCHNFNGWEVENLAATRFDHNQTDFPIFGAHTKKKCVDCHKDLVKFEVEEDFSDCAGCHDDAHRSVISANKACSSCHNQKVRFEKTAYDHAKDSGWPLRGKHGKIKCEDCHAVGSPPRPPVNRCATCHEDVHQRRFEPEACEGCHIDTSFQKITFDHNRKTEFPLTAVHATTDCQDCHRFGIGPRFEKFETSDCASCHQHTDAHCGQFGSESCERCHVQGGDVTSKFDHSVTRLPLEQGHQDVDCERCHRPAPLGRGPQCKDAVKYTGLDSTCSECHIDVHDGTLGDNCAKCHSSGAPFDNVVFDHNKDSRFALTGFHQVVECESCHPARNFKLGDIRCASCHGDDDVHGGALGDDCAKCHETSGGAAVFDHSVHTEFVLDGTHARIECARCHFLLDDGKSPKEVNKTVEVEEATLAAMAAPGADIDLQFRAPGQNCQECHPDPHKVTETALDCESCHNSEVWENPPRNGYHEMIGFSFDGAHSVVGCQLCHEGSGSLAGRGERCIACHVQDDVHAGSIGSDCGRCHEQSYWLPSTFSHVEVGFILEGVHRTLDCRSCHQQGNYFIGDDCVTCHLQDYRNAIFHAGVPNQGLNANSDVIYIQGLNDGTDCGSCHTQFSFVPASGAAIDRRR